jgi:regulator of protease activity HflC (stomatin/prohibitin superfamily)
MFWMKTIKIRSYEKGLYFRDGEFKGLLGQGTYRFFDPRNKVKVDVVSMRHPWLVHPDLDIIIKSGVLKDLTIVLDMKDYERALVWIDGRFSWIAAGGQYVLWKTLRDIRVEMFDAREVRFVHKDIDIVLKSKCVESHLLGVTVAEGSVGAYFCDGRYVETLSPGQYAFWKGVNDPKVQIINMREQVVDIPGQEIMTLDKVTLRLNALVSYRVIDPVKSVLVVDDVRQALYRETQLALRALVGTRELDTLLSEKDKLASDALEAIHARAEEFGLKIISLGIRDIILPGEMKDLLNKVTEAKKAAEANFIARREETAAMRSQANTAKLLENNPTLMRLRELEVLEKVAGNSKFNVVLGEKGLTERVVNLL